MEKAQLTSTSCSDTPFIFSTPYRSISTTSTDSDCQSDSNVAQESTTTIHRSFSCHGYLSENNVSQSFAQIIPPIGVFWDIENCQVPRGSSAVAIVQLIRRRFFTGYREVEFLAVCDVTKETRQLVEELNDAQVNVIHVPSLRKNAADEKLRQSIRRFSDTYSCPAAVILISGDVNFAPDLSDLMHRKKIHVILLHLDNSSDALILCSNEHYSYTQIIEDLPKSTVKPAQKPYELLVTNLPTDKDSVAVKRRLKRLSENCGGRVVMVTRTSAVIQFSCLEFASRAMKRMDGENVYGHRITVMKPDGTYDELNEHDDFFYPKPFPAQKMRNSVLRAMGHTQGWPVQPYQPVPFYPQASHGAAGIIGSSPSASCFQYNAWNTPLASVPQPLLAYPVNIQELNINSTKVSHYSPVKHNGKASSHIDRQPPGRNVEELKTHREKIKRCPGSANSAFTDTAGVTMREIRPNLPYTFRKIRGRHSDMKENDDTRSQSAHDLKRSRTPSPSSPKQSDKDGFVWTRQVSQDLASRRKKTPSPFDFSDNEMLGIGKNDSENFFKPISCQGAANTPVSSSTGPIMLQVTNLDQTIDIQDVKKILTTMFKEHVAVLHISVFMQSDGNVAAHVKVPSLQDAQYAVSQLHRRKLGFRRMLISYMQGSGPKPQLVRAHIVSLLQEVPGHSLPLFKFRELFENRFLYSVSISDIYKMKDVCLVTEELSGRIVTLNPDHRNTPSPCLASKNEDGYMELPYCRIHYRNKRTGKGWAEQDVGGLPNIYIRLKKLSVHMHVLLQNHNGTVPLPSLPDCYESLFEELEINEKRGVPLEHLVSCLPGLEIYQGVGSVKYLRWAKAKPEDSHSHDNMKCVSPPLASQLALFNRELVDLLRTSPRCQLPFSRFIPAYHHHFGRQCRVADYGFTKLIDLLEAIPHIVQVMGEGNKRVVTLSHSAQVRRFTSDLLRVLKSLATKKISLSEFPMVYQRVLGRPWDIVDYGVCEIQDILDEVPENTITVSKMNEEVFISILKREQTSQEKERTKKFASEVIELLRHAPHCTMLFNKFIPSYHHHFGHQCRVSDYGFTKLIELFEAIPDIVRIDDDIDGERTVSLALIEKFKVLAEQLTALLPAPSGKLLLSTLPKKFQKIYGYTLQPKMYECSSVEHIVQILQDFIEIVQTPAGPAITLAEDSIVPFLGLQVRRVMLGSALDKIQAEVFLQMFWRTYNKLFNLRMAERCMQDFLKVTRENDGTFVELMPLQKFACKVYLLLYENNGSLPLTSFGDTYFKTFGERFQPKKLNFPNIEVALKAIPDTVLISERNPGKKLLLINTQLSGAGFLLPNVSCGSKEQMPDLFKNQIQTNKDHDGFGFNKSSLELSNFWDDSSALYLKNMPSFQLETPKKDSSCPPSEPSSCHSKLWSPPSRCILDSVPCKTPEIHLPLPSVPPNLQTTNLMSPMPALLPADLETSESAGSHSVYMNAGMFDIVAPHPSEVPLPCLSRFGKSSQSKVEDGNCSDEGKELLPGCNDQLRSGNRQFKCKKRLAAQFNMS